MGGYWFDPGCDHKGSHVGHIKDAAGFSLADVHGFAKQTTLELIRDANALAEANRKIGTLEAANAEKAERIAYALQALDDGSNSVPEQRRARWVLKGGKPNE